MIISNNLRAKFFQTTLFFLNIFILFLIFYVIFYKSKKIDYFIDEVVNLEAGVNFITSLNYKSIFFKNNFDPQISTGIFVTLVPSAAYIITESYVIARFVFQVFIFFLICFLIYFSKTFDDLFSLFTNVLFLFLVVQSISKANSNFYTLGEIPSSLLYFTGLTFIDSKKYKLSFLIIGISIFLGKFILFLPAFLTILLIFVKDRKFVNFINCFLYLFLPFGFWISLVIFQSNYSIKTYFIDFIQFFINGGGVDNKTGLIRGEFFNFYNLNTQVKIVLPYFILLFFFKYMQRKDFLKYNTHLLSITGIFLWYFLISPSMYYRYTLFFQIGYGIVVLYLFTDIENLPKSTRLIVHLLPLFYINSYKALIIFGFIILILYFFKIKTSYIKLLLFYFLAVDYFYINLDIIQQIF